MKVTDEMVDRALNGEVAAGLLSLPSISMRAALEAALANVPEPADLMRGQLSILHRAETAEARVQELEAFSAKQAQQALELMQERNAHSARVLELQAKLARICEWMKTGALEASLFDELHEILESP